MKIKKEKEKIEEGIVKRDGKVKKITDIKWVLIIMALAFSISVVMSLISELVIPNTYMAISIFLVLFFVFLGIIFDIIGVAVSTSDDKVFHSMAAKKVFGAKRAIKFINKKDKVSSFCNDVIGDICGVISGSCGLAIALKLSNILNCNSIIVTVIITSIISSLTIGGKALGKSFAVNKGEKIVFEFSKFVSLFTRD